MADVTGNTLKRARRFLGYTRQQMADAIGLSLSTYARRERLAEEVIPRAEGTQTRTVVADEVWRWVWIDEGGPHE